MKFVFFHGISFFSRLIRWFTRSSISHVGYLSMDGLLIEAWKAGKWPWQIWWDLSFWHNHKTGTKYEIWELEPLSTEEREYVENFFMNLARYHYRYDWRALFGFLFRLKSSPNDKYICSEGCCTPLKRWRKWDSVNPAYVSPDQFRMILQAAGAKKIEEGVCD